MTSSSFLAQHLEIFAENWAHANAYYLKLGQGVIIDPSIPCPAELQPAPQWVVATHAHYDHVRSLESWLELGGSFGIAAAERPLLVDTKANASELFGKPHVLPQPAVWLEEGHIVTLDAEFALKTAIYPGHTPGCSVFALEQRISESTEHVLALFTGDFVFADSIGRCDLLGGDYATMKASLSRFRHYLLSLDPSVPVFPGHGEATTVASLLARNVYLRS